jgi:hypothetical protein
MTATTSRASIDPSQIQGTLEKLGYKLLDFGDHWRTTAIYRGGVNALSIKIYKNSGVWTDYSSGTQGFPFEKLLQLTLKTDQTQLSQLMASLKTIDEFAYAKKELIEMEEIYPESILQKLFPNFNYYTKKGFSEETLRFYKTGLAGAGKMYRRMVFPIYNEHKQIVGFSGRKTEESNETVPKWKHLGKKRNWVYPAMIPNEYSVDDMIRETQEVALVESIGDSMALFDSGIKGNLVTFGIGVSPALIAYLTSMPIKKIVIVGNNDANSKQNTGCIGAVKILMSLSAYFDFDSLEVKLPPHPHNDLSEAYQSGYNLKTWYNTEKNRAEYLKNLHMYIKKNMPSFPKKQAAALLTLIENYE